MALQQALLDIYAPVQSQVDAVRQTVSSLWTDVLRIVHGPDLAPPDMGGKWLRPALCLLSAGAIGVDDLDPFVDLAATFEVLHLAALTHDDVVDRATLRRGAVSLNVLWNDRSAVLGGDYLVARATTLLTPYGSCPLIDHVVNSVRDMAEGELWSLGKSPDNFTQDDCIRLADKKTARLFAAACASPVFVHPTPYQAALDCYGTGFGIAFQLADDLLDLTQTEEKLGKPACGDIVEGKPTIPLLLLRDALDAAGRERLRGLTGSPVSAADRSWVVEMLNATGARKQTEAVASSHLESARNAALSLPPSSFRTSMLNLLDFILIRSN